MIRRIEDDTGHACLYVSGWVGTCVRAKNEDSIDSVIRDASRRSIAYA